MRTLLPLPEVAPEPTRALGSWFDDAPAKRSSRKRAASAKSPRGYERARAEAGERARANDWQDAQPAVFVGLYALLHEQVYGVPPAELVDVWQGAVASARGMLAKEFGGNPSAFCEFIRWTWKRERGREEKRRSDGAEGGFRIGWVLQFKSRAMLTDYRVEVARAQEAAKPRGKR